MEHRILTQREQDLCKSNLEEIASFWKFCTKRCKHCNYPLSGLIEHNYSMSVDGIVCELCHQMECAVRGKKGLEAAQAEWRDEQKKKKKILEQGGSSYFDK